MNDTIQMCGIARRGLLFFQFFLLLFVFPLFIPHCLFNATIRLSQVKGIRVERRAANIHRRHNFIEKRRWQQILTIEYFFLIAIAPFALKTARVLGRACHRAIEHVAPAF